MHKQKIIRYGNHKESNERTKIDKKKPLLKEETTHLRLMCSPSVCSRKKETRTAASPPPSSLSSFFFSNMPAFLVLTSSMPPLPLLNYDYK
jgi:hypothetical protein